MQIKTLLKIFLSFFILGCANQNLPVKPDGWHCTYAYSKFFCNSINNPDEQIEFTVKSPEMHKAQCMPLDTFERYQSYVQELKILAESKGCKL